MTWKRIMAGSYEAGEWTIHATDRDDDAYAPGYEWTIHHPDKGEFYAHTLRDAKAAAERVN